MPQAIRVDTIVMPQSRRRAGRPTAQRAAEIERVIRDAARTLFLEAGFDATSMDAIAAKAGVSKGTLYTRYASKDALLSAALDDLIGDLHLKASAKDDQLPSALRPRLLAYAHRLVETLEWNEYAQLRRLMQVASGTHPDVYRRWHDAAASTYMGIVANAMRAAACLEDEDRVDWDSLANLFVYGVSGWYASACEAEGFEQARFDAYCRTVVDAIVAVIERAKTVSA
jgi:AcrR family transcriptional regulator